MDAKTKARIVADFRAAIERDRPALAVAADSTEAEALRRAAIGPEAELLRALADGIEARELRELALAMSAHADGLTNKLRARARDATAKTAR